MALSKFRYGIISAVAVVGVLAVAPQASAATATTGTTCAGSSECLILSYNSNQLNSYTAFRDGSIPNFAGYTFLSAAPGQGLPVKNNAASAETTASSPWASIFYNSGYSGACDSIPPNGLVGKLHNTYNENASFNWTHPSSCYDF
ncbi:hypothetical protein [Streptacidiphilus cavernicola]|uniref:Peptidase inhibitor family I36 n=1 Tax=Streptacidiphilus cavernicola TaxID=3342716 RepID=A0ABV6VV94_9ACTN